MLKQKCLVLLSRVPYPPVGGDKVKSYNLIKILAKKFHLSVVVVTDERLTEEGMSFLMRYCDDVKIFRKPKYRFVLNALFGLFRRLPIQVSYYYFRSADVEIKKIAEKSDFIIANLIRMSNYVINIKKMKYLDIVDSIGLNYLGARKKVRSFIWRIIYRLETKRVLEYEKLCIQSFESTFFVNYHESKYGAKYGSTAWIPNGVNNRLLNYSKTIPGYNNSVAFFGKMDYQPNIDAILWYINNVHSHLPSSYKFIIVGAFPSKAVISAARKFDNIEVTGYIEDPFAILKSCSLVVSPMQTGGGIQNKILESMALGQINVVTSKAASPIIGAINKKHFFVCDKATEMQKVISAVLADRESFAEIGTNARKFVASNFTWELYENRLFKLLRVND